MMKRLLSIVLVAGFLQGCGGSKDDEVAVVDFDSPFSCKQLNAVSVDGDQATFNNMIASTLQLTDRTYIEDNPIQNYYRNYLRNYGAYSAEFVKGIAGNCLKTSKSGITNSISTTTNELYAAHQKQPAWAMCSALNDGHVKMDQVIESISKHVTTGYLIDISVHYGASVINSKDYGKKFFAEEISKACLAEPRKRLYDVIEITMQPTEQAITFKAIDESNAAMTEKARKQYEDGVAAYGVNLYTKGQGNCEAFNQQYNWSSTRNSFTDGSEFKAALHETISSIPTHLKPYQQEALNNAINDDLSQVAYAIYVSCSTPGSTLESAIPELEVITSSRTKIYNDISALNTDLQSKANSCSGFDEDCSERLQAKASEKAKRAVANCEEEVKPEDLLCFSDAQTHLDYQVAILTVRDMQKTLAKKENKIKQESMSYVYENVEKCKAVLVSEGARGSDYENQVKNKCEPQAAEIARKSFDSAIAQDKANLDQANQSLDQFKSRAINNL